MSLCTNPSTSSSSTTTKSTSTTSSTSSDSTSSDESSSGAETSSTTETTPAAVDKSSLQSYIQQAEQFNADNYTSDSYQAVVDAHAKAKTVYEDENATQYEVDSATSALSSAISALEEAFNPDNYKAVAYNDLARTPDDYTGSQIVVSGRVLQVIEGSSENDLRIATDGSYDDVVLVGYDPSLVNVRILEDDNVTVYGTSIGIYTYTATLGQEISVPALYADQININ